MIWRWFILSTRLRAAARILIGPNMCLQTTYRLLIGVANLHSPSLDTIFVDCKLRFFSWFFLGQEEIGFGLVSICKWSAIQTLALSWSLGRYLNIFLQCPSIPLMRSKSWRVGSFPTDPSVFQSDEHSTLRSDQGLWFRELRWQDQCCLWNPFQ